MSAFAANVAGCVANEPDLDHRPIDLCDDRVLGDYVDGRPLGCVVVEDLRPTLLDLEQLIMAARFGMMSSRGLPSAAEATVAVTSISSGRRRTGCRLGTV
jgi:hypothetical protein